MKKKSYRWLILPALVAVGAAAANNAEDFLRKGNDAFRKGAADDSQHWYQKALDWYKQAERRITDPGLAAYNKAVVLYQLERYREAELHFQRSLEDAVGMRRAQAVFGLGNSMLMQANEADVQLLQNAIQCYQICRRHSDVDPSLQRLANHNLELARLLLIEAKKNAALQSKEPPANGNPPPKAKGNGTGQGGNDKHSGANNQNAKDEGNGQQQQIDGQIPPINKDRKIPVHGHPPVIPDEDELVPLSPEDTTSYLNQIAERILQQRRQYEDRASQPVRGVKDW